MRKIELDETRVLKVMEQLKREGEGCYCISILAQRFGVSRETIDKIVKKNRKRRKGK